MLKGTTKNIHDLTAGEIDRMFTLMDTYYEGMKREKFIRDLNEKNGVIILTGENGEIQGFSTYLFIQTVYQDRKIATLFSGDTIISREYWGSQALVKSYAFLLYRLIEENKGKLRYWFLISKGFRTYMPLPLHFKIFYPSLGVETPPFEKGLIEYLANMKYKAYFNPQTGIIEYCSRNSRCVAI